MSLQFSLTRKAIKVRDQAVTLREWTPAERNRFIELRRENPERAVYFMVATCVDAPAVTADEVEGWPATVLDEIVEAIMALNGAGDDGKNA